MGVGSAVYPVFIFWTTGRIWMKRIHGHILLSWLGLGPCFIGLPALLSHTLGFFQHIALVLQQVPAIFSKWNRKDGALATLLFMTELTLHSSFLLAGERCAAVNLGLLTGGKKRTMVRAWDGISSSLEQYNSSFCLASHDIVWYMEYILKIAAVEVQKLLYYTLLMIREQYQEKALSSCSADQLHGNIYLS